MHGELSGPWHSSNPLSVLSFGLSVFLLSPSSFTSLPPCSFSLSLFNVAQFFLFFIVVHFVVKYQLYFYIFQNIDADFITSVLLKHTWVTNDPTQVDPVYPRMYHSTVNCASCFCPTFVHHSSSSHCLSYITGSFFHLVYCVTFAWRGMRLSLPLTSSLSSGPGHGYWSMSAFSVGVFDGLSPLLTALWVSRDKGLGWEWISPLFMV